MNTSLHVFLFEPLPEGAETTWPEALGVSDALEAFEATDDELHYQIGDEGEAFVGLFVRRPDLDHSQALRTLLTKKGDGDAGDNRFLGASWRVGDEVVGDKDLRGLYAGKLLAEIVKR